MPITTSMRFMEALERRILTGLSCEYDQAKGVLAPEFAQKMKKPIFSLKSMNGRLGAWSGETMEITLSREFVLDHPWDSVREVLIHEMAHQLAELMPRVETEPAHGRTFREACRLLRANPEASGRYPTLHQRLWGKRSSREDRIMARVRKLMALAESSNQHEAESALMKASELIRKHNIDLLERNARRNFLSVFLGRPALRHTRDRYHLARLLQEFYCVEGVWVPAYVVDKEKMGRALEISGTRQNVQTAGYVWDYIRLYIDAQWREFNRTGRLNRFRKTDFAVGLIEGFRETLQNASAIRSHARRHRALISVQDPLLQKYVSHRYPDTTVSRGRPLNQDGAVVAAGERIGRQLVIPEGIPDGGIGPPALLPDKTG
ncbi:hypothetical protein D3OALGA1CA_4416 [Olavius algarvensis associated proteobacterium Delta 3]|nr:hypothetical protein D3OALGB2SA_3306 [Olavius algarvensis associated proteobacterium Delta 3]CAB5150899.1 hypothetical protein D3OALGA1CA_4416 [Olavius algarvensis associated proteobacterium Delta 3]